MRPQIAKEDLAVPTADDTVNAYSMDVIGNKTDAAAAGAVTATESIMAYIKQNVTNTEAAATSISTINGYHDVPTADVVDNAQMRDVMGNKTDAAAAGAVSAVESLMAYIKQNVTNTEALGTTSEKIVETVSIALPQTGTTNLFTVSGLVQIIEIKGAVDTAIGAVANATKLVAGGGSVDICTTVDVNAAAQFSIFSITGTFANAMIINVGGAFESQANPVTVGPGNIVVDCAGSDGGGGRVTWTLVYKPVSSTGSVVAA